MRRPIACLIALLSAYCTAANSGCYHMYSQPYGYSGAPYGTPYQGGVEYGAPIQTLTPGQPYTPGNYQQVPQGGAPTYQGGSTLQPVPENNPPPTYNQPGTSNPGFNNPPINNNPRPPDPYFQGTSIAPPQTGGLASIPPVSARVEPAPLGPPTAGLRDIRTQPKDYEPRLNSVSQASAEVPSANNMLAPTPAAALMPVTGAPSEPADFSPPVMAPPPFAAGQFPERTVTPASAESVFGIEAKKVVTANAELSPFGHDPQFQWIRGVVSKAPHEARWTITYTDTPDQGDKLGGSITLAPSPHLEKLKDGDVVEVKGLVDDVVQDQHGKPVYIVSTLTKSFESQK